jgi:CubicO group peptidase (beta-lactamase class C family)
MTGSAFECRGGWEHRLVAGNQRGADGGLAEQPVRVPPPSRSGGGGMISTAPSYARFLRFMLGDGTWEGERIISREAMAGLTSDQVPGMVAGRWKTGMPAMSNDVDFSEGGTAGHSLGFLYSRSGRKGTRAPGTLSWAGIANLYYWIDRAAGVAGAVFMQVLPFADERCLRVRDTFEDAVYAEARG